MTFFGSALLTLLTLGQAAPTAPAAPIDQAAAREFLLKGKIVSIKTLSTGVTRPRRVTLTDGTLTHDAVFQIVDESKAIERFPTGRVELDFRDSWHFNIAAFELARAIGLEGMVPPCVERVIQSERGSLCWWVIWKWDEKMRVEQKLRPPDTVDWQRQWDVMRVFRELVDDTDRNQTNMLITEDWRVWMVDFSRAFRKTKELRAPAQLRQCPEDAAGAAPHARRGHRARGGRRTPAPGRDRGGARPPAADRRTLRRADRREGRRRGAVLRSRTPTTETQRTQRTHGD